MKKSNVKIYIFSLAALIIAVCAVIFISRIPERDNASESTDAESGYEEINGVIEGSDGWLYYAATLGDYTGGKNASDRKIYNTANNVSLIQKYCEMNGIAFVFATAPNKNSLYYENMPESIEKSSEDSNASRLFREFERMNVNFVDLFSLFSESDELLYMKTDSHWNELGAEIAYEAILDAVNKAHASYDDCEKIKTAVTGDLSEALSEENALNEEIYTFDTDFNFTYTGKESEVTANFLLTENESAKGSLLMFRDSFGNRLVPFMAEEFSEACFSKGVPFLLERYAGLYSPDTVVLEIAERNVTDYAVAPPVIGGIKAEMDYTVTEGSGVTATFFTKNSYNDMDFLQLYGTISGDMDYTDVIICVDGEYYEAFTVTDSEGDYSYLLYLKKDILQKNTQHEISVYIVNGENAVRVYENTFNEGENYA